MYYDKLKSIREDRDLTQQEVARYLEISRSAYSNYENGIRAAPIEIYVKLATYYRVSVDELIGLA